MHLLAIKEPAKTIFIALILCRSILLRKCMKPEPIVPGLAKVVRRREKTVVLYLTNAVATFIAALAPRAKFVAKRASAWRKECAPPEKFPDAKFAKPAGWDGPMTVQNALTGKSVRWDNAFPSPQIPIVPPKPVLLPDMSAARGMTPVGEFLIAAFAPPANPVPRRANALTAFPRCKRT
jgi:hypothetical protein